MWPFSGFKINVYSEGLRDCFSYKVKDHFTVLDVKQKAASTWRIEDPTQYELYVTDGSNRESTPVQLSDNEYFRDLKRNYDSEHIYYIYQRKPNTIPQEQSATASTPPPQSPQETHIYPQLSFTDNGPEFVNPIIDGFNSSLLEDWNVCPTASSPPPSKQFSNSIYAPLASTKLSFVRDPTAHLPSSLKSLNLASLTMIPHEILNFRWMSQGLTPIELTLERDLLHAYTEEEKKYQKLQEERQQRIRQDETRIQEQIEREFREKEEEDRRRREKEAEDLRKHLELERQQQLQREKEERELRELQRLEREERARLEQLRLERERQEATRKRIQQEQEARRLQLLREQEERELLELKRQQAEEQARVERLRKEHELQEAKRREELEQRRREQEFVEQLVLFETKKVSSPSLPSEESPPPYRPPNGSNSGAVLLDLPPPGPLADPFVRTFVDRGFDPDVVTKAIAICGQDSQQVSGYLSEYNYYLQCGYQPPLIHQGLRLFGANRTKCFQFFSECNGRIFNDKDLTEALNLYQGDIDNALRFLEGVKQLAEMGLTGDRAKQALYSSQNDPNQAAAILFDSNN